MRPWFKPFEVEYEFTYAGIGKKGAIEMAKRNLARFGVLAAAFTAVPAFAGDDALLQRLMDRLEKIEKRNTELEKEIKSLKDRNAELDEALAKEEVSEKEPELDQYPPHGKRLGLPYVRPLCRGAGRSATGVTLTRG